MSRFPRTLLAVLSSSLVLVAASPALEASAAQPGGSLVIVTTTANPTTTSFPFALSPAGSDGRSAVSITGAGSVTIPFAATSALSVAETLPRSFGRVTVSCVLNGGSTGVVSGATVSGVRISPNKATTCTFAQTALPVTGTVALSFAPSKVAYLGGNTVETWSVRNTSAFPARISRLDESWLGSLSAAGCRVGTVLAAGAACTGSVTSWVSQPGGGTSTRTLTAGLVSDAGATWAGNTSATLTYLTPTGGLRIDETITPSSLPKSGGWVTATVTATNQSASTLTLGDFEDSLFGLLDFSSACHSGTQLAPGQACSFSSQWWFSSPTGAPVTSTVWQVGVTSQGTYLMGQASATVAFS